jgi:hypothetical protein
MHEFKGTCKGKEGCSEEKKVKNIEDYPLSAFFALKTRFC